MAEPKPGTGHKHPPLSPPGYLGNRLAKWILGTSNNLPNCFSLVPSIYTSLVIFSEHLPTGSMTETRYLSGRQNLLWLRKEGSENKE
jgi:hypothetical protein